MIRRMLRRFWSIAPSGWTVVALRAALRGRRGTDPLSRMSKSASRSSCHSHPALVPDRGCRPACPISGDRIPSDLRADYLAWLKSTPWTVESPCPSGPVELVPRRCRGDGRADAARAWPSPRPNRSSCFRLPVRLSHLDPQSRSGGRGCRAIGYVAACCWAWPSGSGLTRSHASRSYRASTFWCTRVCGASLNNFPWATEGFSAERTSR